MQESLEKKAPQARRQARRYMQDATGMRGAKKKHENDEAPLSARVVTNVELRKWGHYK